MLCKLCHKDLPASKADPKMCKKCYTDISQYRRWLASTTKLMPYQESKASRINDMIEVNIENGGYVPRFYMNDSVETTCASCDVLYTTPTRITICSACRSKESAYHAAVAKNESVNLISKYDSYYADLHAAGKRVPRLYLKMSHGL